MTGSAARPSTFIPFQMPGIAEANVAAEVARQSRAAADLERYLAEGGPTPEELEAAALLTGRVALPTAGQGCVLYGTVWRHPYIRQGGPGHTAQIVALARDRRWARSLNRLWALDRPWSGDGAGNA